MKLIRFKKIAVRLLLLVPFYFLGQSSVASEKESEFLNREITVFENEGELFDFFEKIEEFNQVDRDYLEEKEKESETHTRRISTQIVAGLSAEEIGDIPALSIGGALTSTFGNQNNVDDYKRLGDYLFVLSDNVLYSVELNQNSIEALELRSSVIVQDGNVKSDFSYRKILIDGDVLVLTAQQREQGLISFSFYDIDEDGNIEFNQRHTINISDAYGYDGGGTKIVNGELVFIASNDITVDSVIEEDRFSNLVANVEVVGSDQKEIVNIASDVQWVNTVNDARGFTGYSSYIPSKFETTLVINCPLSNLYVNAFQCNVTNLLGVNLHESDFIFGDDALFIWSKSAPSLDYQNLSVDDYSDVIRSEKGQKFFEKVSRDNHKKVIYRLGFQDGSVNGILVDGYPINYSSFEGGWGVFFGVLKNTEREASKNGFSIDGVIFDDYQFSDKLSDIPLESYQTIVKGDYLSFIGFAGSNFVMSQDVQLKGKTETRFHLWNVETREVFEFSSELEVIDIDPVGDNVLVVGRGGEGYLAIETWSVSDNPEILFSVTFEEYAPIDDFRITSNLQEIEGDHFFMLEVLALDEDGEQVKHEDSELSVSGVLPFILTGDGSVSAISDLIVEGDIECSGKPCFEDSEIGDILLFEDYLYVFIENELLKGEVSSDGITFFQRLDLKSLEPITE